MTDPQPQNDLYTPRLLISDGELVALVVSSTHQSALKILADVRNRPASAPDYSYKKAFDDLAYATGRWKIYRQDAGMGEVDYCVLRNEDFFCRTDDLDVAKDICSAYDKRFIRREVKE